VNTSPSGAPSSERKRDASGVVALGDSSCAARLPRQLAGDRTKTRFLTANYPIRDYRLTRSID
jgi:hypothetical protein